MGRGQKVPVAAPTALPRTRSCNNAWTDRSYFLLDVASHPIADVGMIMRCQELVQLEPIHSHLDQNPPRVTKITPVSKPPSNRCIIFPPWNRRITYLQVAPAEGTRARVGRGLVDSEYAGCFIDMRERVLTDMLVDDDMTTDLCRSHCEDNGAKYYATQVRRRLDRAR